MKPAYNLLFVFSFLVLVGFVSALPTTGAAGDVNSNGFNVSVVGAAASEPVWIFYGDYSGKENWISPPVTSDGAGTATVPVLGAPLFGGEHVVFQACDATGCGGEMTVTIPAVTVMPTATFGQLIRNITNSRFNPSVIGASLLSGYTAQTPASVVFGVMGLFFAIGIWMRTKSVRLMAILAILLSPMVMFAGQGLYLGMPVVAQSIATGLLAAGISGILLSFIRR
jgi:hypothetical protein